MELRMKNLKLKNFKGIKSLELKPDGKDLNIFGENATGKTTIFDAFSWLLFDKDSKGNSKFGIKTLNKNGEVIHNLDHEVEGIIGVNGKKLTLRKVYYEKWTKSRGSAKESFSGHTTDHYINDVPVKKKEYDQKINEIADNEVFNLVTNPAYFNEQLHWTDRREILTDICGDVSDKEVINKNSELDDLKEIISERDIEDHQNIIKEKMKKINEDLDKIPTRIDEVNNNMPDVENLDQENVNAEIKILEKRKSKKQDELSRIKNGGEVAEKQKKLSEIETEINDLKREYKSEYMDQIDKKEAEIKELEDEVKEIESSIKDKKQDLKRANEDVEHYQEEIEELLEKFKKHNNKTFDEEDTECPTCGQELPEEQIQDLRKKFNTKKSSKLEKINRKGKEAQKKRDEAKEKIKQHKSEIEMLKEKRTNINNKIDEKESGLEELRKEMANADTFQLTKLKKQKRSIKENIEDLKNDKEDDLAKIRENIAEYNIKIKELQEDLSDIRQFEKNQERIKELESKEEELASKYEELEQEFYLTEEFTKNKVSLLENKINGKFELANFKMFEQQVNGGINETCETLYKGVPYSSGLNNGAQINIGLDIIRTLSDYYDFKAPIFVDNAESVVDVLEVDAQMIELIVSAQDEELRIEETQENIKEAV